MCWVYKVSTHCIPSTAGIQMSRPGTPTWAGRLSGSLPCWRSSTSFWSARQSLWVEHKPHRKLTINTCGLLKTWFITAAVQSRTSASVTKCGLDLLLKKKWGQHNVSSLYRNEETSIMFVFVMTGQHQPTGGRQYDPSSPHEDWVPP